jgi:hypothetical protein
MALAQQQLGGVSTGIGFLGSPGWAIGGALALGFLENALSSAKAKEGLQTLERANSALEAVRTASRIFDISDVPNIHIPVPAAWYASGEGTKKVEMSKVSMFDRGKFLRDHGLSKADVVGGIAEVASSIQFVGLGEEFLTFIMREGERVQVRWASVDTFRLVQ